MFGLTLLLSTSDSEAQYHHEGYGKFDLSARVEADTNRVPTVSFRINIPYRRLTFVKMGSGYESRIRIIAYLKSSDGKKTVGDVWEERIVASSYEETALKNQSASFTGELVTMPGRFQLEVQLDVLGTSNRYVGETRVEVPKTLQDDFFLSGLDFWKQGPEARLPVQGGPVWLGALAPDPRYEANPARVYDQETGPPSISFIVYHFGSLRRFVVGYRLVDDQGETRLYGRSEFPGSGNKTQLRIDLDYDRYPPGRYRLEVAASPLPDLKYGRTSESFLIRLNRQSWGEDYLNTIELVKYIATEEELRRLRNTPPEQRQEAWDEFWARRDPNPRTEENEAKTEHFRRIRYANENFAGVAEGWKSDRGRIYITYGEPDEIEERGQNSLSPQLLLWYYYASRSVYVFRDDLGNGDYRLDYVDTY